MARIAGINIPMNKHVWIGLTHIYGVGRARARAACAAAGVDPSTKVKDLTEPEVNAIRSQIAKFAVEGDLRANGVDLGLGEVLHLGRGIDACTLAGGVRARAAHAIDVGEPDPHVLVHRDVDTGDACHSALPQPWRCLWRGSVQIT